MRIEMKDYFLVMSIEIRADRCPNGLHFLEIRSVKTEFNYVIRFAATRLPPVQKSRSSLGGYCI